MSVAAAATSCASFDGDPTGRPTGSISAARPSKKRTRALPFETNFFDAVMSWHSLEHHYSPKATMREVARVLRPGGHGIFAVPSGNNRGLQMFGKYWGPLEAPRHLYHFTTDTLTR